MRVQVHVTPALVLYDRLGEVCSVGHRLSQRLCCRCSNCLQGGHLHLCTQKCCKVTQANRCSAWLSCLQGVHLHCS